MEGQIRYLELLTECKVALVLVCFISYERYGHEGIQSDMKCFKRT